MAIRTLTIQLPSTLIVSIPTHLPCSRHTVPTVVKYLHLSLIHISEPTRLSLVSRMPSSA